MKKHKNEQLKKLIIPAFFCFLVVLVKAQPINTFNQYLDTNNQVLFVKTPFASSIKGKMFLYDRKNKNSQWVLTDSFAVTVGRAGLAKSTPPVIPLSDTLPEKQEGDGKSPAGIFKLDKVFSYHNVHHLKMPFVQVDTNFYCVDDRNSRYYNQLVLADTAIQDFSSFEHMKQGSNSYEYGVWVLYNSNPAVAGNGSCIFLHIWKDENSATSGCTAMQKENMLKLIHWLNAAKNPVLLQLIGN